MSNYLFKIQRVCDGKFSNGGSTPSFTKAGKTWASEGQLRSHLRMLKYTPERYDGCIVKQFKLVESDEEPFDLNALITQMKEDKVAAKLAGNTYW